MAELYTILADRENGEIFTLIGIILLCCMYVSILWGNTGRLGNELTNIQWIQVYALGFTIFLCCVIILGKFVFPQNIELFMGLFGIDKALQYVSIRFQEIVLSILRVLM